MSKSSPMPQNLVEHILRKMEVIKAANGGPNLKVDVQQLHLDGCQTHDRCPNTLGHIMLYHVIHGVVKYLRFCQKKKKPLFFVFFLCHLWHAQWVEGADDYKYVQREL